MIDILRFFEFFHRGGISKHNILIIHQKSLIFQFLSFLKCIHFSYFRFMVHICTMGKEIGRSFKYNWSKISTPILKETLISSSAAHTSSASNLTWTYISSQLDYKHITTDQSKNNISNIDDILPCIQNIILYCQNIIKTITKNNLSWYKIK